MKISTEYSADDAIRRIEKMVLVEDLIAFATGDERKTVGIAVDKRLTELRRQKQGEVDRITEDTTDFKDGVQKVKNYVTCEDVIRRLREKGVKI